MSMPCRALYSLRKNQKSKFKYQKLKVEIKNYRFKSKIIGRKLKKSAIFAMQER